MALAGCSAQPVYGGPPVDSGPDDGEPIGVDAVYGGPPVDSGPDDRPPVDSGPDDGVPYDASDGG